MGIMNRETAGKIIRNVFAELGQKKSQRASFDASHAKHCDEVTFAFQGGEPGLAGLDFYRFFVSEVKKTIPTGVIVNYAFQTNGMCIDENWCAFFAKHDFLVGLSLDGDAKLHNQNRLDNFGKGTFNRVMDAKRKFDASGVKYNILCVLTSESSRRAERIWNFILREDIKYIQFIPCLEPLNIDDEQSGNRGMALTGKKFFRFYSELFSFWKKETINGNFISIKLFDDILNLFLHGHRGPCGLAGRCSPQIIVEADGGVYPCDFYVLDEYKTNNLSDHTLKDVFASIITSDFLDVQPDIYDYCRDCDYHRWCMGGCKRMAKAIYNENCGMRMFLDKHSEELLALFN